MEKFTVPQFIDIEDKILGPITVRQFLIIMFGALMLFLGYRFFSFNFFVIWGIFWLFSIGVVGFLRVNGKPFHFFLLNILETLRRPGARVWDKTLSMQQIRALAFAEREVEEVEKIPVKPRISKSSLSELALIADTGGVYEGEEEWLLAKDTFKGKLLDKPTISEIQAENPLQKQRPAQPKEQVLENKTSDISKLEYFK